MGIGGFFKKIFGGLKKGGEVALDYAPAVLPILSLSGIPLPLLNYLVPIVSAANSAREGKFKQAYENARPLFEKYGITKESDKNLAIELALALIESRANLENE